MIKYKITIADITLDSDNPKTADLKTLRYEFNTNADGQRIDITIANVRGAYDGAWGRADQGQATLIDVGYTAVPGSDTPVEIYRHEYPLCTFDVQNVDYGLYEVTIKAAVVEDDIAADHLSKDQTWKGATIKEIVYWLLADYHSKQPSLGALDIRISNNMVLREYRADTAKNYRDMFDDLAIKCGCVWWQEVLKNGSMVFHFVDSDLLVVGDEGLIDDRLTQPSYALNSIGFVNDIVVIGGGNQLIQAGFDGAEIPDTRRISGRHAPEEGDDGTDGKVYAAPTYRDPLLSTDQQCKERADKMYNLFVNQGLDVAQPTAIGIAPLANSYVAYHLRDIFISGVVAAKTVEFSSEGWICHMDIDKFRASGTDENRQPTPRNTSESNGITHYG